MKYFIKRKLSLITSICKRHWSISYPLVLSKKVRDFAPEACWFFAKDWIQIKSLRQSDVINYVWTGLKMTLIYWLVAFHQDNYQWYIYREILYGRLVIFYIILHPVNYQYLENYKTASTLPKMNKRWKISFLFSKSSKKILFICTLIKKKVHLTISSFYTFWNQKNYFMPYIKKDLL